MSKKKRGDTDANLQDPAYENPQARCHLTRLPDKEVWDKETLEPPLLFPTSMYHHVPENGKPTLIIQALSPRESLCSVVAPMAFKGGAVGPVLSAFVL